jgi:hypothetical protein
LINTLNLKINKGVKMKREDYEDIGRVLDKIGIEYELVFGKEVLSCAGEQVRKFVERCEKVYELSRENCVRLRRV